MALMTQAQHDRAMELVKQCKRFMDWVQDELDDSGLLNEGYQIDMHLQHWGPMHDEYRRKYGPWYMNVSLRKDSQAYWDYIESEIAVTKNANEGEWSVVHDAEFVYTAALADGTGDKAKGETGEKAAGKELPPDGLWLRADYDPDLLDCGRDVK